jgi:hypothetical protein
MSRFFCALFYLPGRRRNILMVSLSNHYECVQVFDKLRLTKLYTVALGGI